MVTHKSSIISVIHPIHAKYFSSLSSMALKATLQKWYYRLSPRVLNFDLID